MTTQPNNELYRQYMDAKNVLWPAILKRLSKAVDDDDKKMAQRIHGRLARLASDCQDAS